MKDRNKRVLWILVLIVLYILFLYCIGLGAIIASFK